MLDLNFVLEHLPQVAENARNRNVDIDLDGFHELADRRRKMRTELDELRRRANEVAKSMKGKLEPEQRQKLIEEGRALKGTIAEQENATKEVEAQLNELLRLIPNMTHPESPIGKTEEENREIRKWGEPRQFDFAPLDHVELGKKLDIIDFEKGTKVAGANFYFLKGDAVLLELAMTRYAIDMLMAEGFMPHITPDLARPAILEGIGFNPRGEETQIYSIADQDLALIATADNGERNGMAIDVFMPQDEPVRTYPVVVANILASALDALAETISAQVAPGGWLAMSGILRGQEDELLLRYAPWFDRLEVARQEDWVRISGRRRG